MERPEYQEDEELHELFEERADRAAAEYEAMADRLLERQEGGASMLSADYKTDARKKVQQTTLFVTERDRGPDGLYGERACSKAHHRDAGRRPRRARSATWPSASSCACGPLTHPVRRLRVGGASRRNVYRIDQEP